MRITAVELMVTRLRGSYLPCCAQESDRDCMGEETEETPGVLFSDDRTRAGAKEMCGRAFSKA